MKDPYQVLNIAESADDEAIKKAYLRQVRDYPPDRDPQRFQLIREAYETLATRRDRLRYRLFHAEPPELDALLASQLQAVHWQRPTLEALRRILAHTLTETQ